MGGLIDPTDPFRRTPWEQQLDKECEQKFEEAYRRIQQQGIGQTSGFIAPAKAPESCTDRTHVQFCPHCGVCHCGGASLNRDKFGPQPG